MKLFKLLLFLVAISYSGCLTMDTACCIPLSKDAIGNNLYVEKYLTFCGGVYGERIDHFLTDSTHFRSNIGWNDEHNVLSVSISNNIVYVYKIESFAVYDTLEHASLSKAALLMFKDTGSATKTSQPLFGINPLACNNGYYASSYKLEDNYFITSDQFKCGNTFINADYLTDSMHFRLLIGFYDVGSGPEYSVQVHKDSVDFYKKQSRSKSDTLETNTFKLSELLHAGFSNACKK